MDEAQPTPPKSAADVGASRAGEGTATPDTFPDLDRLFSGPGGTVSSAYVSDWAAESNKRLESFTADAVIGAEIHEDRLARLLQEMNGDLVIQAGLARDARDRLDKLVEVTSKSAESSSRSATIIERLTWAIAALTLVLVLRGFGLI